MKVLPFAILYILLLAGFTSSIRIYKKDINTLTGQLWKGKLTYLDYSSNKRTSIPADLTVQQSKTDQNTWYFKNEYPKEPHENNIDTVVLSKEGKKINKEYLIKREKINSSTLKLITEEVNKNDGKEKVFRYTYFIGKNQFSIRKEEKVVTDSAFIERNIYEYQRN